MGLALLSSLLIVASQPPHDVWPLAWICLVPLLLALLGTSPREALFLGACTGTATIYLGFSWAMELMQKFSKLGPATYLVMLVMSLYACLPYALWCFFLRTPGPEVKGRGLLVGAMALSACSFAAIEFFFPLIFPWYLANSQHSSPWSSAIVSLAGVSSLSLAIVVVNLCVARLVSGDLSQGQSTLWPIPMEGRFPRGLLATALGVPVLLAAYHLATKGAVEGAMAAAPKLGIGIVQPNQWIGGDPYEGLHEYQTMTEALVRECKDRGVSLDLVLWPESAVRTQPTSLLRQPVGASAPQAFLREDDPRLPGLNRYPLDVTAIFPSSTSPAASLQQEALRGTTAADLLAVQRGYDVPILFGTTLEDISPNAVAPIPGRAPNYNCGVLVDGAGKVMGAVKKVKLMIFGETIPGSKYYPQIYRLIPSASALLSGDAPGIIEMGKARLGIMICYEDLLPWFHFELAQQQPQILLNLTNDAWFGKSAAPVCHLDLAAMRAVEGRCYLVRSTPTGISAVIDPFGHLVASIPSDQVGTLRQEVALLDITTGFERFGDSAAWLAMLYLIGFGGWWWSKGRRA